MDTYSYDTETDDESDYVPLGSDEEEYDDSDSEDYLSDLEAAEEAVDEDDSNVPAGGAQSFIAACRIEALKSESWADVHVRVRNVLQCMNDNKINLPIFLDALSWGTQECRADARIRYARTSLLSYSGLQSILRRWWKPPRSAHSRKSRCQGARPIMEEFAIECIADIQQRELHKVGKMVFKESKDNDDERIISGDFSQTMLNVKRYAPILWRVLRLGCQSRLAMSGVVKRSPDIVVTMIIGMMAYSRNQSYNFLQRSLGIFFKFRGLPIRAFDILHKLGMVASSSWALKFIKRLSESSMKAARYFAASFFTVLMHDNMEIYNRVYSQRIWKQSRLDSGTCGTLVAKPGVLPLDGPFVSLLKSGREFGRKNPLTVEQLFKRELASAHRLRPHVLYAILHALLACPEFGISTYKWRDSDLLARPQGIKMLPVGEEHRALQFILQTQHVSEASLEGNDVIMREWFRQLGLDSPEWIERIGKERVQFFVGDQLTIDRLRGLFRNRAGDDNSFDRMDYLVLCPGWFHIMLTVTASMHDQYLGTSSGRGLQQAFDLLHKKGLNSISTKGSFFHHLRETITHKADAHLRVSWMAAADVKSITDLRSRNPQELLDLAELIHANYASTEAMNKIDISPEHLQDTVFRQMCMWNRDALHYTLLDNAIREGDVGIMTDLLPTLLFRFAGGRNYKYALEILEVLQGLEVEFPPEVIDHVQDHCWLVNFKGHRDSHMPLDMAQEHNNKDIKHTYRPDGPSDKWATFKNWSPGLGMIKSQNEKLTDAFNVNSRGGKHSAPSKESDIEILVQSLQESKVHKNLPRRPTVFRDKDMAVDIVTAGFAKLQTAETLGKWAERRNFRRSEMEDYTEIFELSTGKTS